VACCSRSNHEKNKIIHVKDEIITDTIFMEISNILADNKPKCKHSQSASSHGSEAPKEEEATQEYILVSDDNE